MLILGKANSCDSETITFQIAYGYDACLQFKYAITEKQLTTATKAVSGIDSSRPLSFILSPLPKQITTQIIKNSYVLSVFRLPYLYSQFVKNAVPIGVTVMKVFTNHDAPEIWYVMGVRKDYETTKTRSLKSVVTNQGIYEKELYRISGNLPREFVASLRTNRVKNVHSLHSLTINLPRVLLNNGAVRLDKCASVVSRV